MGDAALLGCPFVRSLARLFAHSLACLLCCFVARTRRKYAKYARNSDELMRLLARPNLRRENMRRQPREKERARERRGRLVFIRRLDRHKFSTIGLAIFPPFETFISTRARRQERRRGRSGTQRSLDEVTGILPRKYRTV